jgi:hypothetical protein
MCQPFSPDIASYEPAATPCVQAIASHMFQRHLIAALFLRHKLR